MRIVLDECVNPRVQHLLEPDHEVFTVRALGWGGIPDNLLVDRLRGQCDVFLTIDQGFEHQHNLSSLDFGIIIVHVARNRVAHYQALREEISQALRSVRPGEVSHVGQTG